MIEYIIDENNKVIECRIHGEEFKYFLVNKINKMKKGLKRNNIINIDESQYELPASYFGISKYHNEEEKEFDIEYGKKIARKKAYKKFYKNVISKLKNIRNNINKHNENLLLMYFYYEHIYRDIDEMLDKTLKD